MSKKSEETEASASSITRGTSFLDKIKVSLSLIAENCFYYFTYNYFWMFTFDLNFTLT